MQANLVEGFDHVYAEPTQELRAQREELLRELPRPVRQRTANAPDGTRQPTRSRG